MVDIDKPLISIIIPVFNRFNYTHACLSDLFRLPITTHEIIVVDNGSTDQTQEKIATITKDNPNLQHFHYIRNPENKGFAYAVNQGFRASTSDNVLFLNNDIRVRQAHSTWTNTLINSINEFPNRLIGPTAGYVDPSNQFAFVHETSDLNKPINYMSGWCLAASKDTWNKLDIDNQGQIFSQEFFAYFEDTDLGFRAKELDIGFHLVKLPLVHFGRISSSQINTQKLYLQSKTTFTNKWKHRYVTRNTLPKS